ncbi:DUF1481 domain-containing protein [Serratia ureilytica]
MAVGIAVGLSACSFHSDIPSFTASGASWPIRGVIRLWRKDDEQHRPQVWSASMVPYRGRVPSPRCTPIRRRAAPNQRNDADGDRDSIPAALCRRRHGELYA